jgi:protein SCO1/2
MTRGSKAAVRQLTAALLITLAVPFCARAELTSSQLAKIEAAPQPDASLPLQLELQGEIGDTRPLRQWLGGTPSIWVPADYTCKTLCGPIVSIISDALRHCSVPNIAGPTIPA